MIRPCFLVIDQQFPGSISTRKLVIETASLNVLTAYSAQEGIETLSRFPQLDGVVLDSEIRGMPCHELIERLRKIQSDIPIVTVSPSGHDRCGNENYHVSSYDPRELLEQLHKICPEETLKAAADSSSRSSTSGPELQRV